MNLTQKTQLRFAGSLILRHVLASLAGRAETVVFRADFEASDPASPPAGWSM
jgi:hypothetical protein